MKKEMHETAIIDKNVVIEEGVSVGPYCIIREGAVIRKKAMLLSNVVIEGETEIGEGCQIYPFASIGLPPQDLKYKGEKTGVKIGKNNIIREYATVHRGSVGGNGMTEIGDNNFLMAYVHVAHDCKIGNDTIITNLATLAGHVIVEDHAYIGGIVAVHQFTRIGAYAMVGGFSGVAQDIPPYTMASGPRAKLYGLNSVGLKRKGFSDSKINEIKKAYKILFREKLTLKDAISKVKEEVPISDEIKHLIEFIEKNKRGICR